MFTDSSSGDLLNELIFLKTSLEILRIESCNISYYCPTFLLSYIMYGNLM